MIQSKPAGDGTEENHMEWNESWNTGYLLAGIFLAAGCLTDMRRKRVPVLLLAAGLFAGIGIQTVQEGITAYDVLGKLMPGLLMLIIRLLTRKGMGMGDVIGILILGLLMGTEDCIAAVCTAALLTALDGGIRMLRRKISRTEQIAFYPFLFLGFCLIAAVRYLGIFHNMAVTYL